ITFRSGLETGGQAFDPPLLPYEKSLIKAIGCTEEEYKTLVRHAMLRQRVRPAEYDHIPDIVNDPVTAVVVNIVVGVLLTAASVLLAPKPPSFEDVAGGNKKKITGRRLADQVGPSRFNQSTSFDNAPSLAELNSPIPIPFGKRDVGDDLVATGGLTLVPALVWSRLYAYGRYQAFEQIIVRTLMSILRAIMCRGNLACCLVRKARSLQALLVETFFALPAAVSRLIINFQWLMCQVVIPLLG
ncbi:MAG: hypothetical protein EBT12_04790, partial [Marivivens sp.]|nr:hypothetical protein [Marivivens sp.]